MISNQEHEQLIIRIQKEMNDKLATEVAKLNQQISQLQSGSTTSQTSTTSASIPFIVNMTQNGDLRLSVDAWFNLVSSGDNQRFECANIYTFPPLNPISTSASINNGSNVLTSALNPFNSNMVGRWVVIDGAGIGGEKFSAVITSFTHSGEVTLSSNASTTVSNATARINLFKLTHKNTKTNPADTVNDALKANSHPNYNSNIHDPDWSSTNGWGRIGKRNIVSFPFGYYASDGTTYIPLHQLFSGRVVFARVNIARANKFVKVKGRLFFGIYNNSETVLDWVRGGQFTISGTPPSGSYGKTTAQYQVVIDTDSGFSLVSNILTINDAPNEAALNNGIVQILNWNRFAGAKKTRIYRKLGSGNVFKLEEDYFERRYSDVNHPMRVDTGSTSFPTISNSQDFISSYYATPIGGLDSLPVDGIAWQPFGVFLPFPPSVNMSQLFDPHLVMGLTEPLATEVIDAEANGSGGIYSVSGAFHADMVGKAYTLRHLPSGQTATGVVSGYSSLTNISLSSSPFAASGCVLEIEDSQPHGLLFDLVGTGLTETFSEWAFHINDNLAKQPSASNPESSSQGGIGGSDGLGGGNGGYNNGLGFEYKQQMDMPLFY